MDPVTALQDCSKLRFMSSSHSSFTRAVLAIVFAAATTAAFAADLELTPPPARPSIATPRARPASAPAEPSVYGFGATDRTTAPLTHVIALERVGPSHTLKSLQTQPALAKRGCDVSALL